MFHRVEVWLSGSAHFVMSVVHRLGYLVRRRDPSLTQNDLRNRNRDDVFVLEITYPMTDPWCYMVLLYMVLHGSHQEIPPLC